MIAHCKNKASLRKRGPSIKSAKDHLSQLALTLEMRIKRPILGKLVILVPCILPSPVWAVAILIIIEFQ